jgi:hypothetical protein
MRKPGLIYNRGLSLIDVECTGTLHVHFPSIHLVSAGGEDRTCK